MSLKSRGEQAKRALCGQAAVSTTMSQCSHADSPHPRLRLNDVDQSLGWIARSEVYRGSLIKAKGSLSIPSCPSG